MDQAEEDDLQTRTQSDCLQLVPVASAQTSLFEGVVNLLNQAANLAKKVAPPITAVNDGLQSVYGIINGIGEFFTLVNDCVGIVQIIGRVCSTLVEIPVVGVVLEGLGTVLVQFTTIVKQFLTPLNKFKTAVLDKVKSIIEKISKFVGKVCNDLTYFATNLPKWANTVQVLYYGWILVSALMELFKDTDPGRRLKELLGKFEGIAKTVSSIYNAISEGLEAVFGVVIEALEPICKKIKEFFSNVLGSVYEHVKNITNDVLRGFKGVAETIKDSFAPVKWALDAISFIFDLIFQPVIDWIMDKLGLNAWIDKVIKKITAGLHLDGLMEKLEMLFDTGQHEDSETKLSTNSGKVSKVHEFAAALGDFTSDPMQIIINEVVAAVSGTPVPPGAFVPPPIPMPPLKVDVEPSHSMQLMIMESTTVVKEMMLMTEQEPPSYTPLQIMFADIVAPSQSLSVEDWSDVDHFIKDTESINDGLKSIPTLGEKIEEFLARARKQLGIPSVLHVKLSELSGLAKFLYDLFEFLQQFPFFKSFLPALSTSLANEQEDIATLDTTMGQLVKSSEDLSSSVQPLLKAQAPSLTKTINQLIEVISGWKTEADRYRKMFKHMYSLDKTGKLKPRIDAIVTTYHKRVAELQGILQKIKTVTTKAVDDGNTIAASLHNVCEQFKKLDNCVDQLKKAIIKVEGIYHYTAKIDGFFKPLAWMLHEFNCVGDEDGVKAKTMKTFKAVCEVASSQGVQSFFESLSDQIINNYFPVQSANKLVQASDSAIRKASTAIAQIQSKYLQCLESLQQMQIGKYQFSHYNSKTEKTETLSSHFFTDDEFKEICDLGKKLN